jgi:hypothetical protein
MSALLSTALHCTVALWMEIVAVIQLSQYGWIIDGLWPTTESRMIKDPTYRYEIELRTICAPEARP